MKGLTIGKKIIVSICASVTLWLLVLATITSIMNYNSTVDTIENAMVQTARIAAEELSRSLIHTARSPTTSAATPFSTTPLYPLT